MGCRVMNAQPLAMTRRGPKVPVGYDGEVSVRFCECGKCGTRRVERPPLRPGVSPPSIAALALHQNFAGVKRVITFLEKRPLALRRLHEKSGLKVSEQT